MDRSKFLSSLLDINWHHWFKKYLYCVCMHAPTCKGMTYLANLLLWTALLPLSVWFVICMRRDFYYNFFQITCFVIENKMAIQIYWFGYYSLWMLITNVQLHICISVSTNLVWHGTKINNRRMPWVMLNYRPNGCRRIGRPLKRLLGTVETGLSRPNWWWMMTLLSSVKRSWNLREVALAAVQTCVHTFYVLKSL